jgi:O-antigen/teichoic acid export membrane protein
MNSNLQDPDDALFNTKHLKNDIEKRALQGGVIATVSQGVLLFVRLASILVLSRIIIPEHFGLISMVTSLTVLIERFQDLGLGDAIVQRDKITHRQISSLFWANLCLCFLLCIIVSLSAKVVAWFYHDARLVWITVGLAANFVFSGAAIQHQALIRRQMRFGLFSAIQILSTSFGIVVGILLAWWGYGFWALVWKELARSMLNTVLAWAFCPWRPGLPSRNVGARAMLRFGYNVTGFNMLYYLTNNLDSVLLGKIWGAVPVGLYSRAKLLSSIPTGQLLEPIRYVSFPALSALQNNTLLFRKYFERTMSVLSFLYLPCLVLFFIHSRAIVMLSLGEQWTGASTIYRLLVISTFTSPIVALLGLILLSSGNTSRYLRWGIFISMSNIIATAGGVLSGPIGVAGWLSISNFVNLVFSLYYVCKGTAISAGAVANAVARPATASLVMGIIIYLCSISLGSIGALAQIGYSAGIGFCAYIGIWMILPWGYKDEKITECISHPVKVLNRIVSIRPKAEELQVKS